MSKIEFDYAESIITISFREDLTRIVETTITIKSKETPDVRMHSARELSSKDKRKALKRKTL